MMWRGKGKAVRPSIVKCPPLTTAVMSGITRRVVDMSLILGHNVGKKPRPGRYSDMKMLDIHVLAVSERCRALWWLNVAQVIAAQPHDLSCFALFALRAPPYPVRTVTDRD